MQTFLKSIWGRFSIVLVIFGIVMLFQSIPDAITLGKDPVDLYDMDENDFEKGVHIETEIELVWDPLYSETTENKTYGVTTSSRESARGYIIPLVTEEKDGVYLDKLIVLKTGSSADYDILEKIWEDTNEWWMDETGYVNPPKDRYEFNGTLRKIEVDESNLLNEYCKDSMQLSSSDISKYTIPYVLVPIRPSALRVTIIVGVVAILLGIGMGFLPFVLAKKQQQHMEQTRQFTASSKVTSDDELDNYFAQEQKNMENPDPFAQYETYRQNYYTENNSANSQDNNPYNS